MCTSPNYAIYIDERNLEEGIISGKKYLKFIKLHPEDNYKTLKARYGESLLSLPCGQCEQCRKAYATNWAVRCALEAAKYKNNWFLTLTYDNEHYKELNKEDIQEFFNNLSGKKKKEFKYWLAGEYGPTTKRAHYHCILINYDIQGKVAGKNPMGNLVYESEIIQKAWGKGFVQIQEAGDNAMAYCAKYATKNAKDVGFKPMMSKGIGLEALKEQQEFINKYGYIQGPNGKKYKIPRYYFKKITSKEAKELKKKQIAKGKQKTAEKVRFRHLEYSMNEEKILIEKTTGRRSQV